MTVLAANQLQSPNTTVWLTENATNYRCRYGRLRRISWHRYGVQQVTVFNL